MAADLLELYDEAEEAGIDVAWFPLCEDRSMALQLNDGSCAIAIDPWKMYTLADETSCLGHELGQATISEKSTRTAPTSGPSSGSSPCRNSMRPGQTAILSCGIWRNILVSPKT